MVAATRGRKPTEDTTPNRARDIQRAFRARRAAHLQSLETRIHELEDETDYLRGLLGMPPAARRPLGKGPTGRGPAKPRIGRESAQSNSSGPTPSSSSPSTPKLDCGIPLHPTQMDEFSAHLQSEMHPQHLIDLHPDFQSLQNNGYTGTEHLTGIDPSAGYDKPYNNGPMGDGTGDLCCDINSFSINPPVTESPPMQPPLSLGNGMMWYDMDQTPVNGRSFSFATPTRALSHEFRPGPFIGHRRSNTDPDSHASPMAEHGHIQRPSTAEYAVSPSPPPLAIRSSYVHMQ